MDAQVRGEAQRHDGAAAAGKRHYVRHRPEHTVLYQIVEQHADTFFEHMREHGASLPRFVREEFDAYLDCGRLERGLVRVKCSACRYEHVLAFSCRGRAFCPSCGARRMVDGAAYLVDCVLPHVPIRQWVLSFPWPLRLLFATRPALLTRVLGIITRALSTSVLHRCGLSVRSGAKTGIITSIQRFGSKLGLNVHLHMLVLDGAYTFEHSRPRFHPLPDPSHQDLQRLLDKLISRITRTLLRAGALVEDSSQAEPTAPYLDLEPDGPLDELTAAALRYRIVLGPLAGRKTMTLQDPALASHTPPSKPFTVSRDGFSLNAALLCAADERCKLERLCRYLLRPPVSLERLSVDGDGLVVYQLKRPFSDGTTHVLFEPLDFIARLAALVPRPKTHLLRYHGLFAPNARHRRLIVPRQRARTAAHCAEGDNLAPPARLSWMARLHRAFAINVETCPKCGGKLRVIAVITKPRGIATILAHRARHASRDPPAGIHTALQ